MIATPRDTSIKTLQKGNNHCEVLNIILPIHRLLDKSHFYVLFGLF